MAVQEGSASDDDEGMSKRSPDATIRGFDVKHNESGGGCRLTTSPSPRWRRQATADQSKEEAVKLGAAVPRRKSRQDATRGSTRPESRDRRHGRRVPRRLLRERHFEAGLRSRDDRGGRIKASSSTRRSAGQGTGGAGRSASLQGGVPEGPRDRHSAPCACARCGRRSTGARRRRRRSCDKSPFHRFGVRSEHQGGDEARSADRTHEEQALLDACAGR